MASTTSRIRTDVPWPLVFGMLAGPIAWSLHLLVSYGLVEVVCKSQLLGFEIPGLSAVAVLILVATLIAAVVTLFAGLIAYRRWRAVVGDGAQGDGGGTPRARVGREGEVLITEAEEPDQAEGAQQWRAFMALAGVLLSALSFTVIVLTGIPAIFLRPCA